MKEENEKILAAGSGYFGIGGTSSDRLKEITEEGNFVKEGVQPAAEDPNADRTAQCATEYGKEFYWDASLEVCSNTPR